MSACTLIPGTNCLLITWLCLQPAPCNSVNICGKIQHPQRSPCSREFSTKACWGFTGGTGSPSNGPLHCLAAPWFILRRILKGRILPFFSKYGCSLWKRCSADSVGFSVNPRRDQRFALKSLSSNRGMDKGKCLHNLFANQIFTVTRRSGEVGSKDNPRF